MKSDPGIHRRRSIRLPGYDYTLAGAYFITIVTREREELFGCITDGEMKLNQCGQIVENAWHDLPNHFAHVELDAFCIMPNHVHGIIILKDEEGVGAGLRPAPTKYKRHPLSEIVRAFKSFSARRINALQNTQGASIWQRNYYEHIIRDNEDYLSKSGYILNNPSNWAKDKENPIQFL
jgi:putative transposase